jgi:hypothetical protein
VKGEEANAAREREREEARTCEYHVSRYRKQNTQKSGGDLVKNSEKSALSFPIKIFVWRQNGNEKRDFHLNFFLLIVHLT